MTKITNIMKNETKGEIIQILGPVVDVEFAGTMPAIYDAMTVKHSDGNVITLEVAKHLGFGRVRAISLASTDGLTRGMEVASTGGPIMVPVGQDGPGGLFGGLGHVINKE